MATGPGIWIGPPGALVELPRPEPDADASRERVGAVHQLAAGGAVVDVTGRRRGYRFKSTWLDQDQFAVWEQLAELPGPYRIVDLTGRRNHLTANQSTGTDALRSTAGMTARLQGSLSSSGVFARSGVRSARWDSATAVTGGVGPWFAYNAQATVDSSWTAVLPLTAYSMSAWARTTAALSVRAQFDWHDKDGLYISTSTGSGVALSTSAWTQVKVENQTSPATAAYGIASLWTTTTTGAAVVVYVDDVSMNQGATALGWTIGTGTPIVAVDQLVTSYPLANYYNVELTLVEVG
jgi:hypothetical protein